MTPPTRCAHCPQPAVGTLNRVPVCRDCNERMLRAKRLTMERGA